MSRWLAVTGVVGPAAFIADWAVLGATKAHYSPAADAISRLAAIGASTRGAMTAGFVVYGAGLALYSLPFRQRVPGRGWTCIAVTGLSTFGVAAFPLGTPLAGNIHAVFAAVGYVTLAAVPLTVAPVLAKAGRRGWSRLSVLTAAVCAGSLLLSVVGPAPIHGLAQRIGLTVGDVWIMASAAKLLSQP